MSVGGVRIEDDLLVRLLIVRYLEQQQLTCAAGHGEGM